MEWNRLTAMPKSLQDASYFSLRATELALHSPSFLKHSCKGKGQSSVTGSEGGEGRMGAEGGEWGSGGQGGEGGVGEWGARG